MGYQHLQVSRSLLNYLFLCSPLAVNDAGKRCCGALQLFTLFFSPMNEVLRSFSSMNEALRSSFPTTWSHGSQTAMGRGRFSTTTQFSGALCLQLTSREHKQNCHTQMISTGQNSLGMKLFSPVLLNQGTFFLQGLCVLVWAILVFSSPKIISTGKNTVFFIPAVFLVTVTISWQYVCILGQNQITCWKCLSPLQFLQHYSQASYIKNIICKRHNRGYIKFYTDLPQNYMQ